MYSVIRVLYSCASELSVPSMAEVQLPELRTREEIQLYLRGVAESMGVALDSSKVAEELDKRDQLAEFRRKFQLPTIGQLLDENERDESESVCCICVDGPTRAINPVTSSHHISASEKDYNASSFRCGYQPGLLVLHWQFPGPAAKERTGRC